MSGPGPPCGGSSATTPDVGGARPGGGPGPVHPDDAERYLREVEGVSLSPDEVVVGVAPRRWFHIRNNLLPHKWRRALGAREPGAETYERFKAHLAAALNRAVAGRRARFLLFPFYTAPWEGDDRSAPTSRGGSKRRPTC